MICVGPGFRWLGTSILLYALAAAGGMSAHAESCPRGAPLQAQWLGASVGPGAGRISVRYRPPGGGDDRMVLLADVIVPDAVAVDLRRALQSRLAAQTGAEVTLLEIPGAPDRRGRRVATVRMADGIDLGAWLLSEGLVVLDGARPSCESLKAAEREARTAGRGLWGDTSVVTDGARPKKGASSAFTLLQGRILTVGKAGKTTYLNFGVNFRSDATVRLVERTVAELASAGMDVGRLAGRTILVRGFAEPRDGLDLPLASVAAIEILE